MIDTVIGCQKVVNAAIAWSAEKGWALPRRYDAYRKAWQRAYDQHGAPYSPASNRLICLTSRLADILS
jgi:hypothetical protein